MTTPYRHYQTCYVCGKESMQVGLGSTNEFGYHDLDGRPPEMKRSTMHMWIFSCPNCGYVASDLSDKTTVDKKWLKSKEYVRTSGIAFKSILSKMFYKNYLIRLADGDIVNAYYSVLHAAWDCDDEKDESNAMLCRRLAIKMLRKLIETTDDEETVQLAHLYIMELLRRTEQFSLLLDEYSDFVFDDDNSNKYKDFQIACAKESDSERYNYSVFNDD